MTEKLPEVLTFGCRLNSSESEVMRQQAETAGLKNVVIVNTCAVTAEAERQAGQAIRRLKRENPSVKILVTGCSAQINASKYTAMPEVDGVVDNGDKLRIDQFEKLLGPKASLPRASSELDLSLYVQDTPQTSAMQRAFVQVQNGCNHRCTFCVIPFGRGASRSLSFEAVSRQVQAFVAKGFQEIVLTGVDIASYGLDLPGQPTLGFMIRRVLDEAPSLPRLRLSSLDPAAVDPDLWELIEQEPRLMPHLHLSLQSGDNMILKRMKRRHSREDVMKLVDRAREKRPDIVFGADIITGFPTETEAMFQNTYDLVEKCGLTWLHVFPYSSRKGTPASRMPQVHGADRKERAERLRALGQGVEHTYFASLVGKKVKILVENKGIGCTPHFAKLKLRGAAPVGQLVDAQCVSIENDSVLAEVIS